MEALYRQHVLKEQPTLQIQGLGGAKKKSDVQEVLHTPQQQRRRFAPSILARNGGNFPRRCLPNPD